MSETPAANDKFVVHSNGHIKRIDASSLDAGEYAFNVNNGAITVKAIENGVKPSSFKDTTGKVLTPSSPYIPLVQNKEGFAKLVLPNAQDTVCGIVNKGSTGFICQNLTGTNVITQQYKLSAPTTSAMYYYDKDIGWKEIPCNAGSYYMQYDSQGIKWATLNAKTLYQHAFGLGTTPNIIMQYNKGTVNNVEVPSVAGNYNLAVDASGNVSFTQGETVSRLSVTYKLSAKEGKVPTLGVGIMIQSGDENIAFDSTYKLKANSRFFVDAKFTYIVNDTSVFDNQARPAKITFKLGSDNNNIVDSQYVYHPESGLITLHFSGVCKALTSETPQICIEPDEVFNAIGVNLAYADTTNLGQITFIEV